MPLKIKFSTFKFFSDMLSRGVKRKRNDIAREDNCMSSVIGQRPLLDRLDTATKGHTNHSHSRGDSRSILFSDKKEQEKKLSREFAQEFHESVLQTTRQKSGRLGKLEYWGIKEDNGFQ